MFSTQVDVLCILFKISFVFCRNTPWGHNGSSLYAYSLVSDINCQLSFFTDVCAIWPGTRTGNLWATYRLSCPPISAHPKQAKSGSASRTTFGQSQAGCFPLFTVFVRSKSNRQITPVRILPYKHKSGINLIIYLFALTWISVCPKMSNYPFNACSHSLMSHNGVKSHQKYPFKRLLQS